MYVTASLNWRTLVEILVIKLQLPSYPRSANPIVINVTYIHPFHVFLHTSPFRDGFHLRKFFFGGGGNIRVANRIWHFLLVPFTRCFLQGILAILVALASNIGKIFRSITMYAMVNVEYTIYWTFYNQFCHQTYRDNFKRHSFCCVHSRTAQFKTVHKNQSMRKLCT